MKIRIDDLGDLIKAMAASFKDFRPFQDENDDSLEKLKQIERARLATFNPLEKNRLKIQGLEMAFDSLEAQSRTERSLNEFVIHQLLLALQNRADEIEIDERMLNYWKSKYMSKA